MCGRFSRTSPPDVLAEEFGAVPFVNVDLRPRYNIAPGQTVAAIIRDGVALRLESMRWGFTASFAKDPKLTPTNARANYLVVTAL